MTSPSFLRQRGLEPSQRGFFFRHLLGSWFRGGFFFLESQRLLFGWFGFDFLVGLYLGKYRFGLFCGLNRCILGCESRCMDAWLGWCSCGSTLRRGFRRYFSGARAAKFSMICVRFGLRVGTAAISAGVLPTRFLFAQSRSALVYLVSGFAVTTSAMA